MCFFQLQLAKDLLHPSLEDEKRKCKLKRLVQSPNSYFMDVKCPGTSKIYIDVQYVSNMSFIEIAVKARVHLVVLKYRKPFDES